MRVMDEKGRLFGKVSVIDMLVVLAVAGLAAGFIYKHMSRDIQQIINADARFYVTFKAVQLRDFSVDAVSEGDIYFRRFDSQAMGKVARVDIHPGTDIMLKTDGTAVLAEMEDRYTLYLTIECTGSVTDAGYYINGYMPVAEGQEFSIHSNRQQLTETNVYRVAETPYEPQE